MSYVPLTLRALMPRKLNALVTHVPRALRALVPHVPRALRALVPHVSRALRALMSHVVCTPPTLVSYVLLCLKCPRASCLASFIPILPFLLWFFHTSH